jgi:hypothetical protein
MCVCDEIGKNRILDSTMTMDKSESATRVELTLCRTDQWSAELRLTRYIGTRYWTMDHEQRPVEAVIWHQEETFIKRQVNYCPICGRRLSLADASRKEDI